MQWIVEVKDLMTSASFNIKNLQGEGVKIFFATKSSNYIMLFSGMQKLTCKKQSEVRWVKPILH